MRLLVELGADPQIPNADHCTALMAAAGVGTKEEDTTGRSKTESQTIEVMEMLLKAGAALDTADSRGLTALHGAALQGDDQVIPGT